MHPKRLENIPDRMFHTLFKLTVLIFGAVNLYWLAHMTTTDARFTALTLIYAVSTGGMLGALIVTHAADVGRARRHRYEIDANALITSAVTKSEINALIERERGRADAYRDLRPGDHGIGR